MKQWTIKYKLSEKYSYSGEFDESFCGVIAELLTKETKWIKENLLTSNEFLFAKFIAFRCVIIRDQINPSPRSDSN